MSNHQPLLLPLLLPVPAIENEFSNDSAIVLHTGDALPFLSTLPADLIHLIITSPPYNLGKVYETRQSLRHYLQEQQEVIQQLVRVLHPQGSICWQVGNFVLDGEVFPLDIYYYDIFKDMGLKLRNRINLALRAWASRFSTFLRAL